MDHVGSRNIERAEKHETEHSLGLQRELGPGNVLSRVSLSF